MEQYTLKPEPKTCKHEIQILQPGKNSNLKLLAVDPNHAPNSNPNPKHADINSKSMVCKLESYKGLSSISRVYGVGFCWAVNTHFEKHKKMLTNMMEQCILQFVPKIANINSETCSPETKLQSETCKHRF